MKKWQLILIVLICLIFISTISALATFYFTSRYYQAEILESEQNEEEEITCDDTDVKGEEIEFATYTSENASGFWSISGTTIPLSSNSDAIHARVIIRATNDENAMKLLSVIETIEDL